MCFLVSFLELRCTNKKERIFGTPSIFEYDFLFFLQVNHAHSIQINRSRNKNVTELIAFIFNENNTKLVLFENERGITPLLFCIDRTEKRTSCNHPRCIENQL